MTGQEEQLLADIKRQEKRAAEGIKQSAIEQARKKDTLAREQAITEDQDMRRIKLTEKQAT